MNHPSKPTVVVSESLDEDALVYLADHADVIRTTADQIETVIGLADGLCVRTYTQVNQALLDRAKRLKVVGRAGVALDNIDISACRSRGVEVVHTPQANTLAVVDYTMAAIISMNRRFWPMSRYLPPEQFHARREQIFGHFLSGMTLGIVGAGRIGSRVGRAAVGLGMKVIYNDILDIELDYPAEAVDKPTLYADSDIVTLHVPLTELTEKFIDSSALGQFKVGSEFINAARGQCVNYAHLAEALRAGRLAAATVDCHDPEPPPIDYPLFGLENVTLTPHIAARVPEAIRRMCDVVYDIIAVLDGRSPQYPAPR